MVCVSLSHFPSFGNIPFAGAKSILYNKMQQSWVTDKNPELNFESFYFLVILQYFTKIKLHSETVVETDHERLMKAPNIAYSKGF